MKGILFDIQRFSVHDGPGVRTNIFLKGCPLKCDWCCNPESQSPRPQPLFDAARCIGCGACIAACPQNAISASPSYRIDTRRCHDCGRYPCVKECYAKALSLAGKAYTVDEVIDIVSRDQAFYRSSDGGITLSGGEAVIQIDFIEELLRRFKEKGFHTAMETCSACPWESIERTLPYVDVYLCDVKHTDPEKMKEETGGDANLILENIKRLAARGADIIARVPVIPGFNSEPYELLSIGGFLLDAGIGRVDLLTYHRMGEPKYKKIFSTHKQKERIPLTDDEMQHRVMLLKDMGLDASIG